MQYYHIILSTMQAKVDQEGLEGTQDPMMSHFAKPSMAGLATPDKQAQQVHNMHSIFTMLNHV